MRNTKKKDTQHAIIYLGVPPTRYPHTGQVTRRNIAGLAPTYMQLLPTNGGVCPVQQDSKPQLAHHSQITRTSSEKLTPYPKKHITRICKNQGRRTKPCKWMMACSANGRCRYDTKPQWRPTAFCSSVRGHMICKTHIQSTLRKKCNSAPLPPKKNKNKNKPK